MEVRTKGGREQGRNYIYIYIYKIGDGGHKRTKKNEEQNENRETFEERGKEEGDETNLALRYEASACRHYGVVLAGRT